MKRPQFSLRLSLLVVALIAVLVSWRIAATRLLREERTGPTINLERELYGVEELIAASEAELADPEQHGEDYRRLVRSVIEDYRARAAQMRQRIEDIKDGRE